VKTVVRNMAWKDNYTLFSTDIETSKNSAKLNNAMAGVTIEEALKPENAARKTAMLPQAIEYAKRAAAIHPTYANPHLLMGNAFIYLEDYETALKSYDYVLSITGAGASDYVNAISNKGLALAQLQTRALQAQNFAVALAYGKQAMDLGQRSVELFGQQGAAFGALGRHSEALQMFQEVLKIDPNSAQAYLNIGYAYRELKDEANANANFERAYGLDPKLRR
jgi:protein O-mannosyl-transferase